ncbi:MAG: radical SAM protein, partial [Planctomycetes bacterium]|nr:radical SAM protein [Planctomycetota bacterium]
STTPPKTAAAIHDFTAKLRQPAVLPGVLDYVKWRRQVEAARKAGRNPPDAPRIAPVSINLDLTTACNYRCDHCIDWDILNTAFKHDEAVLRSSIEQMHAKGLRSVILIGGGEPTVYPGFSDFVRFLKSLKMQVSVVTNGSGNRKIHEIADCLDERDWVRLSLDSGTNDTFIRMHKPVNKEITLESICEWVPKVKAINPRFKYGFSFIIVWKGAEREHDVKIVENIHEIVTAAKLARDHQFDYISLKPFLVRSSTGSEVMDPEKAEAELQGVVKRIRDSINEAKLLEDGTFKVLESTNLRMLEHGNWRDFTNQPKTCHMQAIRQVLTPTGLYNCPAYRGVDRARIAGKDAYKDDATFAESNRGLATILDTFDASKECREVTCLYNDVNWWLEGLVKGDQLLDDVAAGADRVDYFL